MAGFNLADILKEQVSELNTAAGEIISIDLDRIEEDSRNFYSIDRAELEALAGNIELVGQLDPVVVRRSSEKPNSYILLSGHRRCRALRMLRDEGKEQFKTVKAIVREADSSPEFEELVLIFANSNTRKMSSADLSKQTERVTELLYKLKEQGVSFPGRMRDHVAEACQISKTKLARLQAIKNNLIFNGWKEYYEAGKIGESLAYELSKLGYGKQAEFWDWLIDNDTAPIHATLADLKEFEYVSSCYCVETQSVCCVAELIYENTLCGKQCAGCCKGCLKKDTCTTARICPCLDDHFAELDKKAAEKAAEPERENEGTKRMSIAETFGKRLTHCRLAAGYDKKAFAINQGYNPATYSAWENGSIAAADNIVQLAQALNTTTDFLLGASDDPTGLTVSTSDTPHWRHDIPKESGHYLGKYGKNTEVIYFDAAAQEWRDYMTSTYALDNVRAWMEIPEED